MAVWDVFNGDAFSVNSMTRAINKVPFAPTRLNELGIFEAEGITTTTALVEARDGLLSLLQTKPRGGPSNLSGDEKRKMRSFVVPHIPYEKSVLPSDVQNVRVFGSENQTDAVSALVARRLERMSREHDYTLEHLRVGAIQGKVLDADGSEILDIFAAFDISQTAIDFALDDAGTEVKLKAMDVLEHIEGVLGGIGFTGVRALCGKAFWRQLIAHPKVKEAYDRWQAGEFLRQDPRAAFPFGGIEWERYRQDGKGWIPDSDARFVPMGVPDLLPNYFAPADLNETANTIGLPKYARQEPRKFGKGIDIYTESNPLPICTRPGVLVRGHTTVES